MVVIARKQQQKSMMRVEMLASIISLEEEVLSNFMSLAFLGQQSRRERVLLLKNKSCPTR